MKQIQNLALAALLSPLALLGAPTQAETVRDCVVEGTVKRQSNEGDKLYVAFHSAKAAEQGANCRMRRNEKLHFKAPGADLEDAAPGSKVKYRYIEDSEKGATWKLQKVSS